MGEARYGVPGEPGMADDKRAIASTSLAVGVPKKTKSSSSSEKSVDECEEEEALASASVYPAVSVSAWTKGLEDRLDDAVDVPRGTYDSFKGEVRRGWALLDEGERANLAWDEAKGAKPDIVVLGQSLDGPSSCASACCMHRLL
jgi:hypothetical protein